MWKVMVTAPADLIEGYTFEASANGKTFKVTVPPGGVKAGAEFEAPFPDHVDGTTKDGAPTGKFKIYLSDCGPTCLCPFFMGWCCPGIMAGQVLQRLKYKSV